ncbi:MAG: EthD family reductase [Rhodospirillales bacterium]|nr:EthD family reductase [Rhodospirillales bacterium]MDE2197443.1 EthD family reductase [Rhodospirillales bacterium]MDE2574433.1 EthD family reductase [Rhodospirillales bacterium]
MGFCWFAEFDAAAPAGLAAALAGVAGMARALIHTPAATHDPYLDDGAPPALVLQLYFDEIAALEAAIAPGGRLAALPGLARQQAMLVRPFAVPDARLRTASGAPHCTYLVAYQGVAENLDAWLSHYIAHHPPIMARFPAIRAIEIATRIDWCGGPPAARVTHMQRNKVVFDSADALTAALNSPVRHEMRADFQNFPSFTGPTTHFPMLTRSLPEDGLP